MMTMTIISSPSRMLLWTAGLHVLLALLRLNPHAVVHAKNMNGLPGQYKIANGMPVHHQSYSTDYQSEYFEVYSPPIRTLYSQVFWAGMKPVPLPDHIVQRFANKTMAVVGYEVDQVQRDDNPNNKDIPVPITHAYNHHYCSWLVNSKKVKLVPTQATPEMIQAGVTHGGSDIHWEPQLLVPEEQDNNNNNDSTIHQSQDPMVQFFSEGNGGEFRLSYHGYPQGYAQLILSPDFFHISPMQIDTWNRDEPSAKFVPGPIPRSSRIPPTTAGFSGLLECPCSDRIIKTRHVSYQLIKEQQPQQQQQQQQQQRDKCEQPVQSANECWSSAEQVTKASIFRHYRVENNNNKDKNKDKPIGCSLVQHSDGTVDVYWKQVQEEEDGDGDDDDDDNVDDIIRKEELDQANSMLRSRTRLDHTMNFPQADRVAFAAGAVNVTVAVQNSDAKDAVVILLVGPPDVWFGIGFGTHTMCRHGQSDQCPDGGPYAIIVEGDTVEERQLGYHGPGTVIPHDESTWKVHRNEIVGGNRTVVVTRPRHGTVFSFDNDNTKHGLPIIMARGCSMQFGQHCGHGPDDLHFLTPELTTQICRAGVEGTIQNRKFREDGRCPSFPRGDLKQQHNPTCQIDTYAGGLFCCNHGQSLLDVNQSIPWPDQYLEYHLKFRFYFEEYQPATPSNQRRALAEDDAASTTDTSLATTAKEQGRPSHQNLVRLFWATEGGAGEYDIVPCRKGTPPSQCVHVITSQFRVRDMLHDCGTHRDASYCTGSGSTNASLTAGIQLIYAAPHCHASSCLSVELYNAKTGQLLCRVEPIYGDSDDGHGPYGTEKGYLALPPCLWGSPSEGLPPPVLLPLDTELLSIKRNNNTLPHTGEMALWQMRGIVVPK